MTNLIIGDKVKIIDGSYAVRLDKYNSVFYDSIGKRNDLFEVIELTYNKYIHALNENYVAGPETRIHDIIIRSIEKGDIYLHTSRFVELFQQPDFDIDAPVLVSTSYDVRWIRRHFSHWANDNGIFVFPYGETSWTTEDSPIHYPLWKTPNERSTK